MTKPLEDETYYVANAGEERRHRNVIVSARSFWRAVESSTIGPQIAFDVVRVL